MDHDGFSKAIFVKSAKVATTRHPVATCCIFGCVVFASACSVVAGAAMAGAATLVLGSSFAGHPSANGTSFLVSSALSGAGSGANMGAGGIVKGTARAAGGLTGAAGTVLALTATLGRGRMAGTACDSWAGVFSLATCEPKSVSSTLRICQSLFLTAFYCTGHCLSDRIAHCA